MGFPGGASSKESACQCRRCKRWRFDPWVAKIPWRRKWQPTPVFLPGKIPCTEEPGGGTVMGLQRVGHDWAHSTHFEFWRNTRVSVFRPLPAVPAVVWINARFTLDPSASVKCLLLYTYHVWLPWKPLLTLPPHWFCKGPISICLILQVDVVLKYFLYFSPKPGAPWCEELNVENCEGLEILSCLPPNKLVCHSSMEADRGVGTPGSGTEDILTHHVAGTMSFMFE